MLGNKRAGKCGIEPWSPALCLTNKRGQLKIKFERYLDP